MTPHKHAEVIKAWADGAEIQFRNPEVTMSWQDCHRSPSWVPNFEYRVKPQPKKCIPYKRYLATRQFGGACVGLVYKIATYDPTGDPSFIKWIDTEWQEHEYDA